MAQFRSRIGLTDLAALNLQTLARPFQDRSFASAAGYHQAVREWIDRDLAEAALEMSQARSRRPWTCCVTYAPSCAPPSTSAD